MNDAEKAKVTDQLTEMIIAHAPDAYMREMYGGIMIELVPEDPKSRIGGFFVYTDHVSLEFSHGVKLDDPSALLEGGGKFRRHLKLRSPQDVTDKNCEQFLQQAIALA